MECEQFCGGNYFLVSRGDDQFFVGRLPMYKCMHDTDVWKHHQFLVGSRGDKCWGKMVREKVREKEGQRGKGERKGGHMSCKERPRGRDGHSDNNRTDDVRPIMSEAPSLPRIWSQRRVACD